MNEPRHFYVDMIEGKRCWLLAGPYPTHAAALAKVDEARAKALDADPYKHFAAIGTCSQVGPVRKTVFGLLEVPTLIAWATRVDGRGRGELSL